MGRIGFYCKVCKPLYGFSGIFQMSSQYCRMARSDENMPDRALFRMDILLQRLVSWNAAPASACALIYG
jgi:hypothetical protein